jgi:signal transduction histidine kinase
MAVAAEQDELDKRRESLKQNRAALPEKEKQLEQVRKDYNIAKASTYALNSDAEALQLAKELVLQMDRQAKTLDIDLAGIRGKLKVIDTYLAKSDLDNNVIETLEAQQIEQTIELSGLEARRQAIRRVRDEQRRFCTVMHALNDLERSVGQMKDAINRDEEIISGITHRLRNPLGQMVPPQVYQNKVILYPIAAKNLQN